MSIEVERCKVELRIAKEGIDIALDSLEKLTEPSSGDKEMIALTLATAMNKVIDAIHKLVK